jgi:hypothetical protein
MAETEPVAQSSVGIASDTATVPPAVEKLGQTEDTAATDHEGTSGAGSLPPPPGPSDHPPATTSAQKTPSPSPRPPTHPPPSVSSSHSSPSNGVLRRETGSVGSPDSIGSEEDKQEEDEEEDQEEGAGVGKEAESKRTPGFGLPRKVPILRLKKKGDEMNVVFEKQDASKNDSYCWVCHDGGDVLCCDRCPRVFHVQCSGLPKEPEGEEEWFCPVCKNIDRRTKRSRPPNLKDLLLLAVRRMMFPGTEIFQHPVPSDILKHYKEYIFFPMYLNKIKERVEEEHYGTTRQFLHDTEWILHNCIIYNGGNTCTCQH